MSAGEWVIVISAVGTMFTAIVASIATALIAVKTSGKVSDVKTSATEIKDTTEQIHTAVNSQRTTLEAALAEAIAELKVNAARELATAVAEVKRLNDKEQAS